MLVSVMWGIYPDVGVSTSHSCDGQRGKKATQRNFHAQFQSNGNSDLQEETVAARVVEENQKITVWKPWLFKLSHLQIKEIYFGPT